MKGKKWYREQDIAEKYEIKRFSGLGGSYIDNSEKKSVKKALGDISGQEVLEVAAGTGRFTKLVAEQGAEVTACDISKPMLRIANEKSREKDITKINYLKVDAENLPFKDNEFKVVFAIRFMHLVDNPRKFLEEMARVAEKRIVFDTFSFSSFRIIYNKMLPMGSRLYTDEEVKKLAQKLDLKITNKLENFAIPFGAYRYAPDFIIEKMKKLDKSMLESDIWKKLASVIYWQLEKK